MVSQEPRRRPQAIEQDACLHTEGCGVFGCPMPVHMGSMPNTSSGGCMRKTVLRRPEKSVKWYRRGGGLAH